ncbi:MAG: hypothetical protein K0U98_05970 [Deltaproteobacteria bacterium]|nr:hypothetical protein [Deltaproteobacteria bacterium]
MGPVQASIPPDIGNYGIAEAENDPTDFGWSTSASPVVGRATKEVAWVAPVLHLGAEPQLWEYAVEIVAKVSELTSAVTSASGGLEAVAVAVWRVLLSRTERCLSDPWADPRDTLGNVDDLVVFGHELLSAERTSLPAVLRRNPGCDELLDQFRRRSIWLDELLDAWKRLNRPPGPFRFKPVIQAGDMELHLFEMADGGSRVRLRVREVNSRSARYGFSDLSEPDISVTDKKLSNNADVELEPSGRFLHVRLHKSAVVDVEGIGE